MIVWGGSTGSEVTLDEASRRLDGDTTAPPTPAVLQPAAGVYRYRGEGTDSLSVPPKEQTQGPDMPATVEHGPNGCWTFRIDFHSNHWQTWEYCADDGRLVEKGGTSFQRWDFGVFAVDTTSTFTCADAVTVRLDAAPGDEWTQTCTGRGDDATGAAETTSTGPYRFVGRDTLNIGGRSVDAVHYRRKRTMSGGQRGTETSDVWFDAADALPLRNERLIQASTDTVIGETTYREEGTFELVELDPVTSSSDPG